MSIVARFQRNLHRVLLGGVLALAAALPTFGQPGADEQWVATWATALVARPLPPTTPPASAAPAPAAAAPSAGAPPPRPPPPPATVSNQTLRQVVRTSIGGDRVRVVLSNVFGTAPIEIGAAASRCGTRRLDRAAYREAADVRRPDARRSCRAPCSSATPSRWSWRRSRTWPSTSTCRATSAWARRRSRRTTARRRRTTSRERQPRRRGRPCPSASRRMVPPRARRSGGAGRTRAVVAFGDSITDGARSTANANKRWPDVLARRLARATARPRVAVLNAGISGNRVLGDGAGLSALARFDKDVLMQTGVTHVVVMEGINDIGVARANPTPERRRPDRRASPAHRARARARPEDLRRDADAVRGRWLLHARRRGEAPGAQRLDPHERRVRRRDRLRRRHARSGRAEQVRRVRTPATTCTRRRGLPGHGRRRRPRAVSVAASNSTLAATGYWCRPAGAGGRRARRRPRTRPRRHNRCRTRGCCLRAAGRS